MNEGAKIHGHYDDTGNFDSTANEHSMTRRSELEMDDEEFSGFFDTAIPVVLLAMSLVMMVVFVVVHYKTFGGQLMTLCLSSYGMMLFISIYFFLQNLKLKKLL